MSPRKPDADAIEAFVDALANESWLGIRREWPHELYHSADVQNVAGIILAGALYSRARCRSLDVSRVDSANQEIIARSASWTDGYARLYFRPRTPFLHNVEGIRRRDLIGRGAHCPVPVYLIFHSKGLLTQVGVEFTDGNWASQRSVKGSDAAFLRALPFRDIYHIGAPKPQEKAEIIFRRHAEVLVPDELDLANLKAVVCRTGAERETLLHLLGDEAIEWEPRIRLESVGELLFYREGVFVSSAYLDATHLVLTFQPARVNGPFDNHLQVWDDETQRIVIDRSGTSPFLQGIYRIPVSSAVRRARVMMRVNDCLAYHAIVTRQRVY